VAKRFHDKVAAYAEMVEQDRFQISVITALPEKQRAIDLELERRRLNEQPVPPIRVYVVPELLEILHPRPQSTALREEEENDEHTDARQ
jgi:hypothetical protein